MEDYCWEDVGKTDEKLVCENCLSRCLYQTKGLYVYPYKCPKIVQPSFKRVDFKWSPIGPQVEGVKP